MNKPSRLAQQIVTCTTYVNDCYLLKLSPEKAKTRMTASEFRDWLEQKILFPKLEASRIIREVRSKSGNTPEQAYLISTRMPSLLNSEQQSSAKMPSAQPGELPENCSDRAR